MARKKKFIQAAIKKPGSLTALAKKAGMSISAYCNKGRLSTVAKRKCNLYKNVLKRK